MGERSGALIVVAALIMGASIIAAGLMVKTSLDQGVIELAALQETISDLPAAAPTAAARAPERARPGRPDPSERYEVNTAGSPAMGPDNAKLTLVEFSDFQCPFCSRVTPTVRKIREEYGDDVRVVFKHLPLSIHPKAPAAHAAAEAAHQQGKFWEMHDEIFGNQRELTPEKYLEYAGKIGLDVDKFKADLASSDTKSKIDSDLQEASRLGVTGTPSFFINGRFLSGAQPFSAFKRVIDEELSKG